MISKKGTWLTAVQFEMAGRANVIQEAGINEHFGKGESIIDAAAVIQDKWLNPFCDTLKSPLNMRCEVLKW